MKHFRHVYHSWSDFIEQVKNGKPNRLCNQVSSRGKGRGRWFGTDSMEEALGYLDTGWQEGIDRINEVRREIPSDLFDVVMPVKDYRPELQHVQAGGMVDIAAHLADNTPLTFLDERPPIDGQGNATVQGRRLQSIYANFVATCGMSERAFRYRGALTYLMVEHMENCGYSVELWACSPTTSEGDRQTIYVKVKEFGELFDTNKLCIALVAPFMLRRFGFSIQECASDIEVENWVNPGHYGSPRSVEDAKEICLPGDEDKKPIWLNTFDIEKLEPQVKVFKQILTDWCYAKLG